MRVHATRLLAASVFLSLGTLSATSSAKPFVVIEDVDGSIAKGR